MSFSPPLEMTVRSSPLQTETVTVTLMPADTTDAILAPLNEEQKKAVLHMQGPILVLAGAGSGKTRALTHRIAYLIANGVQPWQILAVTFTNKAAGGMKERIKNLLHITSGEDFGEFTRPTNKLPAMGTFHSICVRILRRDCERLGMDRTFVIYDADDQEKLMKDVLKDLHIAEETLKPKAAMGYVGRFKCEAVSPAEAQKQATTAFMSQVVQAYRAYQTALRKANAYDFDDLIVETVRLFHECPDVLDKYQETWRFIHVDEYQDTNHAQYLLITLLAQKYRNLCVIGDPDQSIYAFRGADIRNILEFQKEYPDATRVTLDRNYRSVQPILTAADAVIAVNPNRPQKRMWTERVEGENITVHEVGDERLEAQLAISECKDLNRKGVPLHEQVILYRTNAQSRMFEEACMRTGTPYRIIGGQKFYGRREVKDVLAYLHVLVNQNDTLSLLRIINVPGRKIGTTTMGHLQAYASANQISLWETLQRAADIPELGEGIRERLIKFASLITRYKETAHKDVVSVLAEDLLYAIDMKKYLMEDEDDGEERWGNVQELLTVMHKYDKLEPWTSLISFLEEVKLVSEVDNLKEGSDALTLMTLHLCKGLEFTHVMIAGCEEGIFPHSSAMLDREQLEEERRLLYVGMTRARERLELLCCRSRMLWGKTQNNPPSRFLDDLPDSVIERRSDEVLSAFAWASMRGERKALSKSVEPYRQGMVRGSDDDQRSAFDDEDQRDMGEGARVSHPSFGTGLVIGKRGDVVEVQFENGQRKSFALSIAPLTVLED